MAEDGLKTLFGPREASDKHGLTAYYHSKYSVSFFPLALVKLSLPLLPYKHNKRFLQVLF